MAKINPFDYIGQKFHRLTITEVSDRIGRHQYMICTCECGKTHRARLCNMKSGAVKSCGCQRIESTTKSKTTHGFCGTSEYNTWFGIKARCSNPESKAFVYYGARGIVMCDRWLESFENFIADMGRKPTANHQIDRIDYNGNYEPSNCRWATKVEQMRNTRYNKILVYGGESLPVVAWAERIGVSPKAIYSRIYKGWPTEDIFNYPFDGKNNSRKRKPTLP